MQTPAPAVRGRVIWIPLVLVGSFLYWTTALGLGALSLTFMGSSQEEEELALEPASGAAEGPATTTVVEEPIVVHLESWSDRATGGAIGTDGQSGNDGTGSLPAVDDFPCDANGPGPTSY